MLICPRCGKTGEDSEFIDGFCSNCYDFKIRCPEYQEFQRCKSCGRIFFKGKWQRFNARKINEYIVRKCKGEFSEATFDIKRRVIILKVKKGAKTYVLEKPFELKFVNTMCTDCSRMRGGYYEAIIQLRGNETKVAKYLKTLSRLLEKKTFISKIEEVRGGIDIYTGSSTKTQEILTMLGLSCLITRKLVGQKEGKKIFRVTFLVRFS